MKTNHNTSPMKSKKENTYTFTESQLEDLLENAYCQAAEDGKSRGILSGSMEGDMYDLSDTAVPKLLKQAKESCGDPY